MKTTVIVTHQAAGFHCWPSAPEEVAYLRARHRHLFHFKVEVPVRHGDRDVEFHTLLERLKQILFFSYELCGLEFDFGELSCEHIAAKLLPLIDASAVEVWEDGECGARVEAEL